MARAGLEVGATDLEHLEGAAAAINYVRIANLVATYVRAQEVHPPVLDWGCGYGQVSWLLVRRGIAVRSFEVFERPARASIPPLNALPSDYASDSKRLPYDSESFGAVLSVGVLEHVADQELALGEIRRVLRPGGRFFIFMLPNKYSWSECVASLRRVSAHPVKYTFREATAILGRHDFRVEKKWRRNFLPRNLTGLSPRVKRLYGRCYRQIEIADRLLANCPGLGTLSGVLEMVTRKA